MVGHLPPESFAWQLDGLDSAVSAPRREGLGLHVVVAFDLGEVRVPHQSCHCALRLMKISFNFNDRMLGLVTIFKDLMCTLL